MPEQFLATSIMEPAIISIIIPVRNESNLRKQLGEVQLETQKKDEIIVVDTSPIPLHHPEEGIQYLHKPNLTFRAQALNEGARQAKGDLLLFLHADCALPSNSLYPLRSTVVEGGCFLKNYVPSSFLLSLQSKFLNFMTLQFRYLASGTNGIFVRKDLFNELNGFKSVPLCEDLLFWKELNRRATLRVVPLCIRVSSRKYKRLGGVYRIALNAIVYFLFKMGVPSSYLKKLYELKLPHREMDLS